MRRRRAKLIRCLQHGQAGINRLTKETLKEGARDMPKSGEKAEMKPMSLVEARRRTKEHKLVARIEGKSHGQAVPSGGERKSSDRKGKR